MSEQLSPTFASSLRGELQRQMVKSTKRRRPARRTTLALAALLGIGLGGTGVALATDLVRLPGAAIVRGTTAPELSTGVGPGTIDPGAAPSGATYLAIRFTCMSAGAFSLNDGVSFTCNSSDVGTPRATMRYQAPLPTGSTIAVSADSESAGWSAVTNYVTADTTAWGTNSKGDSYGVHNEHGAPDLIAVTATNGRQGYIYADDLDGPEFSSPEEALAWQEEHAGEVVSLPVYLLDGETQIGEFTLSPVVVESQ